MIDFGADINAALAADQARLYNLLELQLPTPVYFTDCDIPIYYDGNRYAPCALKMPRLRRRADLSADSINIRIGNADVMMAAALQNDDVAGLPAILRVAALGAGHTVLGVARLRDGLIDEWDLSEEEASLSVADERILWQRRTLRKIASVCPWAFKGLECGYAGSALTCNHRHSRCVQLGNDAHFGGHRFLHNLSGREILWGNYSWKVDEKDNENVLPLPYGRCKLKARKTYIAVDGQQRLHIVAALADGPVQGLVTSGGQPQIWLSKEPLSKFGTLISYEFFTGTADQEVCATLRAALNQWNDPLRYTCYLYLQMQNSEQIPNDPEIEVLLDGLIVYNPVTATSAFTTNAALCAYDLLTRPRTRGGCGLAPGRVVTDTAGAAIDYCTAKGWQFNAPITDDDAAADNLQLILDCFRGAVVYSDGNYKLKFRDLSYEPDAVMEIADREIKPGSLKASMSEGLDRPAMLSVNFLNPNLDYEEDELPVPATALLGDTDTDSIQLVGLSSAKAGEMGLYVLERAQWNKRISFTGSNRCWRLEPLDLIRVTQAAFGWNGILLRVEEIDVGMDMTATLELSEEDAVLYNNAYDLSDDQWDSTDLPAPNAAVASVVNVSHLETTYDFRDEVHTRLDVLFDRPPETEYPWWDHAEIWVRLSTEEQWKFVTTSRGDYRLDPAQEGVTYLVRLRSVNRLGAKEDFESAFTISHLVAGKASLPGDLLGLTAVAVGDQVVVKADRLNEPAIKGYEIRLGEAFVGGLFMKFDMDPTLVLIGVRPGLHTFWCAAMDNAGQYAANPVSAQCRVFLPPGLTLSQSWAWDFDGIGTHANTEYVLYSSEDCLRCAHAGDVLSGTWTSPVRDLGSVRPYRIFGDFRTAFISGATTFGGVAPAPLTFADIGALDRSFAEIFQPVRAAQLRSRLCFSTDGSSWDAKDGLEILCVEVLGRWVYVEVSITDPTLDSRLYLRTLNMRAYIGMAGV